MSADSVAGLLADAGIKLKRQTAGHAEKLVCPRCAGGKTREVSLSVAIDADGYGATWQCWRGTCGWKDGARVHEVGIGGGQARAAVTRPIQHPVVHAEQQRPDAMYAFFAARGIEAETVDAFGIYVVQRRFPTHGDQPAIVFPYLYGGELVNRKYRPPQKTPQLQDPDALPTLFNVDRIETPDVVWWVEGEPDVMALFQCGYGQTVTLKDGAPAELRDENDPRRQGDKRFAALATHADLLGQVGKFVLAGDMDAPGVVLREELARRLGRHRCWLVTWPDGCKDACDTLRQHGELAVRAALEAAVPYPIEGVQRVGAGTLERLFHRPPLPLLTIGVGAVDEVMKFPGEGRLIVVTGIPNHGKSSFVTFAMVQTAMGSIQPREPTVGAIRGQCVEVLMGKAFRGPPGSDIMTAEDRAQAEKWLSDRIVFLVSDAEDSSPTLDWILDRAKASVLRDGATDLVIDPWNEVEHDRGDRTETEYIGRSLQRLKAFAYRHGCNCWVIVHPTKLAPAKPGATLDPPSLYDVAGSAHWANKSDMALTVHTPKSVTEIHLRKARFSRWGRRNSMAVLQFDPTTGRYSSASLVPDLGDVE